MKMSKLRCFVCQQYLEFIPESQPDGKYIWTSIQQFECPNVHCQLWYNANTKQISQYVIWVERENLRYKILGYRGPNTTRLLLKRTIDRPGLISVRFQELLALPKFKEITFEDNIVQGDMLFDKMRTLLLFS